MTIIQKISADFATPYVFNAAANPYAHPYEPDLWNDLPLNALQNENNFFKEMNGSHYNVTQTLLLAGYLSLRNVVALGADVDPGPDYTDKSRIQRILSPEDVDTIVGLSKIYFAALQTRANCYGYAINFRDAHAGAKPDPGLKTVEFQHGLYKTYTEAVLAGAEEDGLILEGKAMPAIRKDHYRVAVFMREDERKPSFHWVRENRDGTWSGKDGHGPVRNLDSNGNQFTNPENAYFGRYTFERYAQVPTAGIVPVQFRR